MGEPFKYQSSWKTEDLFQDYYTQSQVNTLVSTSYGILPVLASAPTGVTGKMYVNTVDNKIYIYYDSNWQELHQLSFITAAPVYIETGVPMGLLIGLTYQT